MKNSVMGAVLLAAGLGAGGVLARALEPFVHETELRQELPPCFEIGAPYHHRFRPNCLEPLRTPRGTVPFSVNEDGIRDQARARILRSPRRVLVLGDSYVEGWWISAEDTFSSVLSARFPGVTFINGGIRSSGPLMQAERLAKLLKVYKPERVLWFLNDTDGADERLSCALLRNPSAHAGSFEFGTDDFAISGFPAWLSGRLGITPLGHRVRSAAYQKKWAELVKSEAGARCGMCRGVEEVRNVAREAKVPLLAAYIPADASIGASVYNGEPSPRRELLDCLTKAGIPLAPLEFAGFSPDQLSALYWENDFHLTPEGVLAAVDRLDPAIRAWLGGQR